MAAEGGDIVRRFTYTYTGADGEVIPRDATHVFVDAKIIRGRAFYEHQHIVEVICHDKVEKIEQEAFYRCPSLRRVIMRGVKIVERCAINYCGALTDVECGKLEIIGRYAFLGCKSLRSINLPSARVVGGCVFRQCEVLTDVKFGSKLERFEYRAFNWGSAIERITIPLKDGMINHDNVFEGCINLKHVDLVERAALHETIAALHLEGWKNDMHREIDSINQILPSTDWGFAWEGENREPGEKALVIRMWIRTVLGKMIHYKAEHQRVLDVAATTLLQLPLPRDIVLKNVLSFLELPSHRF